MGSPQYLGAVHDTLREMGYSPRNGMRWCATRTHSMNEFGVCGAMFGQMVRLLDVVCEFVIRRVSSFSTLFGYLVRGRSLAQWRRARSSRVRPRPLCVSEDYIIDYTNALRCRTTRSTTCDNAMAMVYGQPKQNERLRSRVGTVVSRLLCVSHGLVTCVD